MSNKERFVNVRSHFLFRQFQFVQVFPLKLAPSANSPLVSATPISLPLLFSSSSQTLALFSTHFLLLPPSFQLKDFGMSDGNCLPSPPVLLGCIKSPDTHFSLVATQLMIWPGMEHYSFFLQSLVVSLLLPVVSTLLFFRTGRSLSHLNSLTHMSHRCPVKNLFSLQRIQPSVKLLSL